MATFCVPGRIETGFGSMSQVGELLQTLGGNNALIIMDSFLAQIGLNKKIETILADAGMGFAVYSGVAGEPTSDHVAAGVEIAARSQCDCVLAVGGGSSIDTAKAIAVKIPNPNLAFGDIAKQQYLKRLPLIAVPTTAGTGSEATKVSVITNAKTGIKENPGHPAIVPDIAVLDPELMMTLPSGLTAFTGMDALTHAMEAYVSNKANKMSDIYAYEAIKMVGGALEKAVEGGLNREARQRMAIASCFAGIAFSNSSTNLAHAGGRALGAYFHIPHGLSVALLLPFVMEFGLEAAEDRYAQVAVALGANPHDGRKELARKAVAIVYDYNDRFKVWTEAKEKFITDLDAFAAAIPEMVKNALAGNGILTNPIVPTEQDVTAVFQKLAKKIASV